MRVITIIGAISALAAALGAISPVQTAAAAVPTCENKGLTTIRPVATTPEDKQVVLSACRRETEFGDDRAWQEYGMINIARRATVADSCTMKLRTVFRGRDGGKVFGTATSIPCNDALRKASTFTYTGFTIRADGRAQTTQACYELKRGSRSLQGTCVESKPRV
jgi:hypothetical protein